jgi:HAD superfamily hydrolase (TIGR01484 family)
MTLPALIACDVDGTLFNDDETITPRTRDAIRNAVAAGARFVVATGRPPRWIRPVVDALGFAPMAVCANGAVIYDSATDRVVSTRTLAVDTLGELAELATRVIPGAGLAVERIGERAHDTATPQFISSPGYEHAWLNQHRGVDTGPAQRAGHQAADPPNRGPQFRHGRRTGQARRHRG